MLINSSSYNFFIIFDLHRSLEYIQSKVQVDIMFKHTTNAEKSTKSKNSGMVPTTQLEPDFSWTCSFCEELHNVEFIMYMKFVYGNFNDWMQRYGPKTLKIPLK